uniref:Ycf34 n=2 Tax=Gracilariopsis TaxID=2781 RepID=A0A1C9CEX5_9FLOR|nr:Ycf334 [Gracilariopsis lemaneiformis]YP_009294665.1 hypothetical protein Gch_066 [Gracilariopsis chorda]AJO68550.1 hypothetical protein [Gracilariopsis lemaneiformis]AML79948.1 Ycf334 [Gracilariopsis lemaneiformis]AOM66925.1 hypothetical protein Gch_066 [Gracilariopsis chorda]UAD88813.1 hypothetical protein [Gracilariopsis chorda]
MCICVNCRHVQNCTTYQLIKYKHQQKQDINIDIDFFVPKKTLISINIIYSKYVKNIYFDWDLIECLSFVEMPGYWTI